MLEILCDVCNPEQTFSISLQEAPVHAKRTNYHAIILRLLLASSHLISGPHPYVSYHQAHKIRRIKQDISRHFNWA